MCHLCGNPDHLAAWVASDNQPTGAGAGGDGPAADATGALTVSATGTTDIGGLLGGVKWNDLAVSYNFPTDPAYYVAPYGLATGRDGVTTADLSTGFVAVTSSFKTMVQHALAEFSAVTNLTFNEVGAGAASNIAVARTTQLGSTSALGFTGYGYYPGSSQRAGDVWFASSTSDVGDNFSMGRGTYFLVLHELGHAMGLKHGHQTGGVANTAMTAAHDFNDYSIMSYRREENGATSGLSSEAYGRPQTLMMYDIAALQAMYGANFNTNNTNSVYTFSTSTGQMFINGVGGDIPGNGASGANRIYRTLWDGGGVDTYNFSNYATNLVVDLAPGGKSTLDTNQLAVVNSSTGGKASGNLFNALQYNGNAASLIENAIGGTGADSIAGNIAANDLKGGLGNDTLSGLDGNDTLDGGAGSDRQLGGNGNDVMVWDASDDLANVLGGADTDTLLVKNAAAPTAFDLVSHEFEAAIVVTDDPGGNWWLQISDYYNAAWQRTNSDARADNGSLVQTTFDVSPGGLGVNWQYISDYRNASNVLTNQDGQFDGGGTFAKSYDYAAGTGTDGISDELREFTYFFRNVTDQQNGVVLNVEGFYDDGRKFTQTNDIDTNQPWQFQTNWYKTDGVTPDFLEVLWDNGSTQIIPY